MIIIFWITGSLIAIYMAYPIMLWLLGGKQKPSRPTGEFREAVSVILLTYNGGKYTAEKIAFLLEELRTMNDGELIIIDDHSTDDTRNAIEKYRHEPGVRVILKSKQSGIPHSMNLGVSLAKHNAVVFCDQRQHLLPGSLKRVLAPLTNPENGAVSGCISHLDKAHCKSLARIHENYIKAGESRIGGLMGVYGPLYAVRKKYFTPIPENIILDDLYLSMRILQNKKIVLVKNCAIIDEKFSGLYNYARARRYLTGLVQIITNRPLLRNLPPGRLAMLLLHKYLRLIILGFLFLTYLASGLMITAGTTYLLIFILMTLLGFAVVAQMIFKFNSGLLDLVRINFYYLAAAVEVGFRGMISLALRKFRKKRRTATHTTFLKEVTPEKSRQPA